MSDSDQDQLPASPSGDDLKRGMDNWQLSCQLHLMLDYGHSYDRAATLAWFSRSMLEADLRKPFRLSGIVAL